MHSYVFNQQINNIGENKPDLLEQKNYFSLFMNEYRDADAAQDKCLFGVFLRVFIGRCWEPFPFDRFLKIPPPGSEADPGGLLILHYKAFVWESILISEYTEKMQSLTK